METEISRGVLDRRRLGAGSSPGPAPTGLFVGAVSAVAGDGPPRKPIDFAHDIVPLIKARCAECHTDGKYKGSFSLDTREAMLKSEAVVPGKSGESELIERLTSDDPDYRMPQKGQRLTADEVARLKAWIDQGVPWETGLHVQAPRLRRAVEAPTPQAPARAGRPRPPRRPHRRCLSRRSMRSPRPSPWTTRRSPAGCSST